MNSIDFVQANERKELDYLYRAGQFERLARFPELNLYPQYAEKLCSGSVDARAAFVTYARIERFPAQCLRSLACDKEPFIRATLASSADISVFPEVVDVLSRDQEEYVRVYLAGNPAIAHYQEVVRIFAISHDDSFRARLARNPAVADFDPEVVQILAADQNIYVRGAIMSNPSIPEQLKRGLTRFR